MERPDPHEVILSVLDPLGREVVARFRRWTQHVEDEHPELTGMLDPVGATISRPDAINSDVAHPHRDNYYRRGILPAPYDHLYLKVSVQFARSILLPTPAPGELVTAYPAGQIQKREARKWSET